MDVTEIGRRSPAPVTGDVLVTGVIWAVFQTSGTLHCVNEKLTNLPMTGPSFTAHVLYIQDGIPSGPGDVDLILPKTVMKKSALNGTNADKSLLPKLRKLSNFCSLKCHLTSYLLLTVNCKLQCIFANLCAHMYKHLFISHFSDEPGKWLKKGGVCVHMKAKICKIHYS